MLRGGQMNGWATCAFMLMAVPAGLTASAQGEAVQWTVDDGGNGHWYEHRLGNLVWNDAQSEAASAGGYLATLTSEAENGMANDLIDEGPENAWIGGKEIDGQWTWVTGEPWEFASWNCDHCHPSCQPDYAWENCVHTGCSDGLQLRWGNFGDDGQNGTVGGYIIEWSADCNGDGIVDYGQIVNGVLEDADGNGVPDCCDEGVNCFPCPADFMNDDGEVGVDELLFIISAWGTDNQTADLDGDGWVDVHDILMVLDAWGPCSG